MDNKNDNKNDVEVNTNDSISKTVKSSESIVLEFDPKRSYSVGEVFKTPSCKNNYFSEYCECCKCLGCLNHENH